MKKLLLVWAGIMLPWLLLSNYYSFLPYTVTQPNGEVINCFVSGDEYFNWLHDKDGFTIMQSPDGYYYYATAVDGEVKATSYKVNSLSPERLGLKKWAKLSESSYQKAKDFYKNESLNIAPAPHNGTLNNIVIYIRFSDDSEFTTTRQSYNDKFNSGSGTSLKSYFSDVSYGSLDVSSTHYPDCPPASNYSYQDSHPRAYYEPYNATTNPIGYDGGNNGSQRTIREQTLLRDAVAWINANSPVPLKLHDLICLDVESNRRRVRVDCPVAQNWRRMLLGDANASHHSHLYDETDRRPQRVGHFLPPNSWRLSGEGGAGDVIRCSRGLGR